MTNLDTRQMHYNMQRLAARGFIYSKGRMPHDDDELEQWLVEFTDHMADMLHRVLDGYNDHMKVCNHPIPLSLTKEKP